VAFDYLERAVARGRTIFRVDLVYPRRWRRTFAQVTDELDKRFAASIDLDLDLAVRVSYPTDETVLLGQLKNERAKADTLNDAAYSEA
jgi:hypothetical protein